MFLFFEEGECLCLLVSPQWRSEGGKGSWASPRGGGVRQNPAKDFKKFIQGEILIILKEKDENVVIFFFDYILDISATSPPPPPPYKINNNILIYLTSSTRYGNWRPPPSPCVSTHGRVSVHVAYWTRRSWPPADTVSHVNLDQRSGDMAVGSRGLVAIRA